MLNQLHIKYNIIIDCFKPLPIHSKWDMTLGFCCVAILVILQVSMLVSLQFLFFV
jgi:hypothetical protein